MVAVQQSIIRQSNPRSVVGTKTKILASLSMLYASEGRMACSICGTTVGGDLVCKRCENAEERLGAHYFSANSPKGMCLQCEGRGVHFELVMEKLVPAGWQVARPAASAGGVCHPGSCALGESTLAKRTPDDIDRSRRKYVCLYSSVTVSKSIMKSTVKAFRFY